MSGADHQSQISDSKEMNRYTNEFLENIQTLLDYDGIETFNTGAGISQIYSFNKDTFNTNLSVSARSAYDDVLFYHVIHPERYRKERKWSAEKLVDETAFSVDQEGMAYNRIRPGIVRQENQPQELVNEIKALDNALYRNAKGDRFIDIKQELKHELRQESLPQKIWRNVKKEIGL